MARNDPYLRMISILSSVMFVVESYFGRRFVAQEIESQQQSRLACTSGVRHARSSTSQEPRSHSQPANSSGFTFRARERAADRQQDESVPCQGADAQLGDRTRSYQAAKSTAALFSCCLFSARLTRALSRLQVPTPKGISGELVRLHSICEDSNIVRHVKT